MLNEGRKGVFDGSSQFGGAIGNATGQMLHQVLSDAKIGGILENASNRIQTVLSNYGNAPMQQVFSGSRPFDFKTIAANSIWNTGQGTAMEGLFPN